MVHDTLNNWKSALCLTVPGKICEHRCQAMREIYSTHNISRSLWLSNSNYACPKSLLALTWHGFLLFIPIRWAGMDCEILHLSHNYCVCDNERVVPLSRERHLSRISPTTINETICGHLSRGETTIYHTFHWLLLDVMRSKRPGND